jgi:hypothetical protein
VWGFFANPQLRQDISVLRLNHSDKTIRSRTHVQCNYTCTSATWSTLGDSAMRHNYNWNKTCVVLKFWNSRLDVCRRPWVNRDLERSKSIAKSNGTDGGDAFKFRTNSSTQTTCMCCHSKNLSVCSMGPRQHPRHITLWLQRALAATP